MYIEEDPHLGGHAHYNRYSVADIMGNLDIPEGDLRSVQRDMQALIDIEGGYIRRIVDSGKTYYQVALERANKLVFPEFGDTLLHVSSPPWPITRRN